MKNYIKIILFFLAIQLFSCKKEDILPPEIGSPIPYTPDATRNWVTVLNDADFSLFKTAYEKSNIKTWVKSSATAFQTVFIPTNKAFESAGYNLANINNTSAETLDSLLAYYIVPGMYNEDDLKMFIHRSFPLNTLLKSTTIPGSSTFNPYVYRIYVGTWNDSLAINGHTVGLWKNKEETTDGYVYKIDKMINKPTQTVLDFIKSQPRFSMLLEAINASSPYYESEYQWSSDPYFANVLSQIGVQRSTYYLPTNTAFANSGFHTLQDVNDRIERSLPIGDPFYDDQFFYQYPRTAIDSILMPHGFSLFRNEYDAAYFKMDLMNYPTYLGGFIVQNGSPYQNGDVVVETSFKVQNNQLFVAGYRSKEEYQPLTETNIFCLNGVVHVVNSHLMKP